MDWQALLELQQGVARRDQLRSAGLTTTELRMRVRTQRWQSLGEIVVVAHNGPLTRLQQMWAAVLAHGDGAMLGGLTALEVEGLRNWSEPRIHVLTRRARTRSQLTGVPLVIHETRVDPGPGRVGKQAPRRATPERAAVDAASWHARPRASAALLAAVVQQRLTTPERLQSAWKLAGPIRNKRLIRLTIADISGGAEALSELDFAGLCRRHMIGTVKGQAIRTDRAGRRRYLDGEIIAPNGRRRLFEIDGSVHLEPEVHWDDLYRQNELVIAAEMPLRYSTFAVRFDESRVAAQLRRSLA
jgi:hypothetical protein